jgi:hypothetical protein
MARTVAAVPEFEIVWSGGWGRWCRRDTVERILGGANVSHQVSCASDPKGSAVIPMVSLMQGFHPEQVGGDEVMVVDLLVAQATVGVLSDPVASDSSRTSKHWAATSC